jgi:hypothetical protein
MSIEIRLRHLLDQYWAALEAVLQHGSRMYDRPRISKILDELQVQLMRLVRDNQDNYMPLLKIQVMLEREIAFEDRNGENFVMRTIAEEAKQTAIGRGHMIFLNELRRLLDDTYKRGTQQNAGKKLFAFLGSRNWAEEELLVVRANLWKEVNSHHSTIPLIVQLAKEADALAAKLYPDTTFLIQRRPI